MIKQVLVVAKYLNMRKGKIAAQCCHASLKVFFDIMNSDNERDCGVDGTRGKCYTFYANPEMTEWIDGIFTKICVSVDSEQELLNVYNQSKDAKLPCSLITDSGLTEFNGVPTITCCAIGPANTDEIDKITGRLKLL